MLYCYLRVGSEIAAHNVEVLLKMVDGQLDDGDRRASDDGDLDEDVREWFADVNRGELIEVNEHTFNLFCDLERLTCDHLEKTYKGGAKEVDVNSTVQSIVVGIQSSWARLAVDIPVDSRNILLSDMVDLWLKIRGHSMASQIVERYKQATAQKTKGTKGIRKTLKFGE